MAGRVAQGEDGRIGTMEHGRSASEPGGLASDAHAHVARHAPILHDVPVVPHHLHKRQASPNRA